MLNIALTGHRPEKLGGYNLNTPGYIKLQHDLETIIEEKLKVHPVIWCHSGLALGADTCWSKAILNMRAKYQGRVLFHVHVPMWSQKDVWPNQNDIAFWQTQVNNADRLTVYDWQFQARPAHTKKDASRQALHDRNIGMVNQCDMLLAVYDGVSHGGTKGTIDYASSVNKEIMYMPRANYF